MKIIFYNTKSPNNMINKVLTNALTKDIKLKIVGSVLNPVIEITSNTVINYNYCYIEKFKRYYYINDIEIYPNNIYTLHCAVDVLKSYANDILNSYALISQNTTYNKYLNDNYLSLETKEIEKYESEQIFNLGSEYVLCTIGALSS